MTRLMLEEEILPAETSLSTILQIMEAKLVQQDLEQNQQYPEGLEELGLVDHRLLWSQRERLCNLKTP